jgi:DNA polymerase
LLRYYRPHTLPVEVPWGGTKDALHYTYTDKSRATVGHTYGGALVENITQGAARDFMAEAMVRLDTSGFPIVLTVHDEILCETEKDESEFVRLMEQTPAWAEGFPLKVGSWVGRRFKK